MLKYYLCVSTDVPRATQESLQHFFVSNQEMCPNVSVVILLDEIEGVGLTHELTLSSSDDCVLQECPMLLTPGERINITLMDGVEYTGTLLVSNDCGNDSTLVSIHPESKNLMCLFKPVVLNVLLSIVFATSCFALTHVAKLFYLHVWQSQIEIEYYSIAYFEPITEFDML